MHVMIVDNDEAWTRSVEILLKDRGHEVTAFTEPVRAWGFIEQTALAKSAGGGGLPDVVLLDYLMPELSGYQLLARMADNLKPECRIVFLTGHKEQMLHADLKQMGVSACVAKPVDGDRLVEVVEQP